ncbi:uncharacterized protein LOC109599018 isoform X2 [Aethina tumida]|uniref:uncharacterized protein LOC109599018 isoform X2 n=1 Tax=Aethina tumida TaxID=116153 RepID=UPI0021495690|nr:uncharacterized protein LOC109599018 isoform X2 [Aethina tumida]
MCLNGCGRFWTTVQIIWSTLYIICGGFQLVAGIFFLISVRELQPYSTLFTGTWNIILGIVGGMIACINPMSPRRQEIFIYLAISILTVNFVNVILSEWELYFLDKAKLHQNHSNHMLIDYACFAIRIAEASALLVSLLDSQLSFCSMHVSPPRDVKLRGSHEQVSDIEYIIPRPKSSKPHTVYDAYAQSWVFDAENAGCSTNPASSPYTKITQNGTPRDPTPKSNGIQNGVVKDTTHLIDNPVVHIEEASDDSTSNSDRKLCHMKSFSRSASPVVLSASSSQISLNLAPANHPQIYECLEKLTEPTIYRSRLNTAVSSKSDDEPHYHSPQAVMMRRMESISPHGEKVQYASLMKELQRAIVNKKDPTSVTSPQSTSDSTTQPNSNSSRQDSSRSDGGGGKNSDAEFSKELEAALQLIQDLESPNTIETPSEQKEGRPLAVWRNSDASESEKTLSAVGSLAEITSPITECQPELYTFKPSSNGKGASVVVHYPDSQSTSGYSSPTHQSNNPTPNWSTTSSMTGSNNDIVKPISYSIHNAKSTTVISLYTQPHEQSKGNRGKSDPTTGRAKD